MNIWYSYDPEDGYSTHVNSDEASKAAEASLEYHRDRSTDGWHENTSDIEWGLLVPYGETRETNRKDAPGGDFDYTCDYQIVSAPCDDPLEQSYRRLERSIDFYQQRFNALRTWVKGEVEPLSRDVAQRYFAIVANGSPAPHEGADWRETIHGMTLRAERAERERDELRAEVNHWKGAAREHAENLTAARSEIETLLNALASISVDEYETTSSASEKVHGHAKIARRAISNCRQLRTGEKK